ncbi:MAG TPA: hypothetical protein DCE44_21385, partial [Verrucomicrobiales bacterium]|nr:hypothetical protein [Verrucomicrobiales bacterium]
AQAATLSGQARWGAVRELLTQANEAYRRLGSSPLAAKIGYLSAAEASPESLIVFRGHETNAAPVTACAISPDSTLVVSGGRDGSVKLWDLLTGCERTSLSSTGARLVATEFSPDGTRVLGARADGRVQVWEVLTRKEIA